jgi:hypothetical protein
MRCNLCGEEVNFEFRAVIDGDGRVYHTSCFTAVDTGQTVGDLDRGVDVIPDGEDNVILVDFKNKKRK